MEDVKLSKGVKNHKNVLTYIDDSVAKQLRKEVVALDVETTGYEPGQDVLLEIGIAKFKNGKVISTYSSLINQGYTNNRKNTVSGFNPKELDNAPTEDKVIDEVIDFLGGNILSGKTFICGHNTQFDINFLTVALNKKNIYPKLLFTDTLELSRRYIKGLESYNQESVQKYFGITNTNQHRALDDAIACGEILFRILDRVKPEKITPYEVHELSDEQKKIIEEAEKGNNILVDACIGSGKTYTIHQICNTLKDKDILYLTYNSLLKDDARSRIYSTNTRTDVDSFHSYCLRCCNENGKETSAYNSVDDFLKLKSPIMPSYDILIIDEYQDIYDNLSKVLLKIKKHNPNIQIIAVGDADQKINDKTTINSKQFIKDFMDNNYIALHLTKSFRISPALADKLGNIWGKHIEGVNTNCKVDLMSTNEATEFLLDKNLNDILVLGSRSGSMMKIFNKIQLLNPDKFNKNTIYLKNSDFSRKHSDAAVFSTYDAAKGMERSICIVCDFTDDYWYTRSQKNIPYEILRNLFCVAASRGKEHIIFVTDYNKHIISDEILCTDFSPTVEKHYYPSTMFKYKYDEDIERCYELLNIKKIEDNVSKISFMTNDGFINLIPCLSVYQKTFFSNFNIDKEIQYIKENVFSERFFLKQQPNDNLHKKILYLVSCLTEQDWYYLQADENYLDEDNKNKLFNRLANKFKPDEENVQQECNTEFIYEDELYTIEGFCDVIKNKAAYKLVFSEVMDKSIFLETAYYALALNLPKAILWNTYTNEKYEIRISAKKTFYKRMINLITKGAINGNDVTFIEQTDN